jgi:hypothetical protein
MVHYMSIQQVTGTTPTSLSATERLLVTQHRFSKEHNMKTPKKDLDIRFLLQKLSGRSFYADELIKELEDALLASIDVLSDDLDVEDYVDIMIRLGWVIKSDVPGLMHVKIM